MKIDHLTFIVTDDCNFNCSYCIQKKEKKTISRAVIETAVDFFYPFFKENADIYIGFYGGEPLLAYEELKYAALLLTEKNKIGNKKIKFSVTTNGSLLNDAMFEFFDRSRFKVLLSFDGLAQDKGRRKNTLEQTLSAMKRLQARPGIHLEINSVFSPLTIGDLSSSLRYLIEQQAPEITFNISIMEKWQPAQLDTLKKELRQLTDFLAQYYNKTGAMPVTNFRFNGDKQEVKKNIFRCCAGRNRMAVSPGGEVWGCFLFHDYFKGKEAAREYGDYAFGSLAEFIADYRVIYPQIMANYSALRQDYFKAGGKFCFLCEELESCGVCPVGAAYASGAVGKICRDRCELVKIQAEARGNFRRSVAQSI